MISTLRSGVIISCSIAFLAGYVLASERQFEATIRGGIKLELAAD